MIPRLRISLSIVMAILVAITITLFSVFAAKAHEIEAGSLSIMHPWARPTLGNVKVSAVYMIVINNGDKPDKLLSVSSEIAERTEIHETIVEGDMARMLPVKGGVLVPADDSADFVPLGKHVMLIGLKKKLKVGDTFPLKLVFEKQGEVIADVKVAKPETRKEAEPAKGSGHGSH